LVKYYTERITQLGQSKYLHVLRWKRLCQTSMAMEELYPLYKVRGQGADPVGEHVSVHRICNDVYVYMIYGCNFKKTFIFILN
jgi:hypothetical protein